MPRVVCKQWDDVLVGSVQVESVEIWNDLRIDVFRRELTNFELKIQ